ncbi:ERV1B [Auxenochlorella protothecoides x Auxenochlorella symbiontica]
MGLDSPTTETGTTLPDHIGMQLRLLGNRAQVLGVELQSHIDKARQAVEDRWAHGARRRQAQRVAPFAAIAAPSGAHADRKEELGRATWTLLHTMAAQFPDRPAPSQQRDVKNLLSWGRNNPPRVASGPELQQYMCEVHNQVNQRLRKPAFNCALAGARWRALDCDEDGVAACAIQPANSSLGARRWPW